MGTTGKVLRGCLLAAGLLVLSMVAVVGLYIGWGLYANERAEKAANALCAGIRIGDPVDAVIAKAQAADPAPRVQSGSEETYFIYQGMIFSARECHVSTVRGRITAKRVILHDDD